MAAVPVVAGGGDNALVRLVWEWLMLIRQCYRWGLGGLFCCQRRVLKQARKRRTSFCHALPQRWHLMSVMLSAARVWIGPRN